MTGLDGSGEVGFNWFTRGRGEGVKERLAVVMERKGRVEASDVLMVVSNLRLDGAGGAS